MSILSKESAVGLPALLVLLDFVQKRVPLDRDGIARYIRKLLPMAAAFAILLGTYLTVRHNVLGTFGGTDAAPGLPHLREQYRVLNAFRAWPEFVRLLFFPLDLSADYAPAVVMPVESLTPMVMLGIVLTVGVVLLMFATPRVPGVGLAAGWFLLTILPVSNFFFPIGVLIAERTLYLPSLAACLLAGFAWDAALRSVQLESKRLAYALALVVVAFFSARTVIRNPDWDSLATVWRSLHRDHPESYRAQWLNAISMWNQGRNDLAERYFEIAYKLWPRDSQLITEWGNFYIGQQRYDKAIELLEQSRDMTPFVGRTYELLAYAYFHGGRPRDALATAQHALTVEGVHRALVYPVLAAAQEKLGAYDEAARTWQSQVALKTGNIWLNWAMKARAEASAGRKDDALRSADVAQTKTDKDPRGADAVRQLKEAITDGCFPAGGDCDPLTPWQVGVVVVTADPRAKR
jgi:tetratricopeptide (TPR) repeat protein